MVTDVMRERFECVLAAVEPYAALNALAKSLKAEGVTQVALYWLFKQYLIQNYDNDRLYDSIADNMDLIWGGPWAKGEEFFEHELTSEEVKEEA